MFPTPDEISLVKSNGTKIEKIRALVQTKMVFIEDGELPIEEGDKIERLLPNQLLEEYLVLDRGYFSFPQPHYQVKVQKESTRKFQQTTPTTIIHQTGDNPKVNINSNDRSITIINKVDLGQFEEIKKVIIDQIADESKRVKCLDSLTDLKESVGKESYGKKYQKFIATVADHMTVIGPFIPFLTKFIL
jgi:hypothetical protein